MEESRSTIVDILSKQEKARSKTTDWLGSLAPQQQNMQAKVFSVFISCRLSCFHSLFLAFFSFRLLYTEIDRCAHYINSGVS